jgi:hypothetical protein
MASVRLAAAWWTERPAARRLLEIVSLDLASAYRGGGLCVVPVAVVTTAILRVVRRLDIRVNDQAAVMAKVGNRVEMVAEKVDASNSNGTLKFFNKAYREHRLQAQRNGTRVLPYNLALSRLRRVVGKADAARHAGVIGPDILARVFGG